MQACVNAGGCRCMRSVMKCVSVCVVLEYRCVEVLGHGSVGVCRHVQVY